ncbi:universal stress protein [Enteractinococcus coprophilus]|uniref:Nucleotide-binding universal stress UspA family protein n=1 Tax=Enteractinococcus coprophilus TaxID=1027633 RepID=A0A543ALZ9_9MICC|nr:universal stress protein [Enteractinococcus coprophilus]TQL73576.1 nucleotide-binding universal stress UspA family protein [Enteractinococcus coprophilus]
MRHIAEHPATGTVVVGVDGSENSERAFDVAVEIAQKFGYGLRVIAAYTEPGYEYLPENTQGLAQENAQAVINDLVATVDDSELGISGTTIESDAAGALIKASQDAVLVVVGKRGRSRFAGRFLGSVSASVASHAKCPTLVIPEKRHSGEHLETQFARLSGSPELSEFGVLSSQDDGDPTNFSGTVVVGVDLDAYPVELSLHAAKHAQVLGKSLTLVTAQPFTGSMWMPVSPIYQAEVPDLRKDVAKRLAKVAEQVAEQSSVEVHWRFFDASPADALAEASRTADMAVVGTRGRGGFAGLLLGSVSQAVLNRAVTPVLVVPTAID